jgi:hypothetical protein
MRVSEEPIFAFISFSKFSFDHPEFDIRDGGYEQLISNGGSLPAFSERDKKQSMIDIRGISKNWFKNQLCPSTRLSRL